MQENFNKAGTEFSTDKAEAPGANKCSDCNSELVDGKCVNQKCIRIRDRL